MLLAESCNFTITYARRKALAVVSGIAQTSLEMTITDDWGPVTPDFTNEVTNEHLCVYNHDLSTDIKIERTIRFIIGRLTYLDQHLPGNAKHRIVIDVRGQSICQEVCDLISVTLSNLYDNKNSVYVEFRS